MNSATTRTILVPAQHVYSLYVHVNSYYTGDLQRSVGVSRQGTSEAVQYCTYQQGVGLTGTDCAWLVAAGLQYYLLGKGRGDCPSAPGLKYSTRRSIIPHARHGQQTHRSIVEKVPVLYCCQGFFDLQQDRRGGPGTSCEQRWE